VADARPLSFDPIAEAERQWGLHGWTEHGPAMAVVTSVMRLQQIFLGRADAVLRPFGLTFARYEVLMLLSFSRRGALPLGKIGERLQVNPASVTNAVDRLEAAGYVTRRSNPVDGRGTLAVLTAAGRRTAAAATEAMNEGVFACLGLPASKVGRLFDLLTELRRAAGDFS
jgi:DNA-binding MarR family transcriptional regulator